MAHLRLLLATCCLLLSLYHLRVSPSSGDTSRALNFASTLQSKRQVRI